MKLEWKVNVTVPIVSVINPANGRPLIREGQVLSDDNGAVFPIVAGVPRFCAAENYTENFGFQWNVFARTQIDDPQRQRTLSSDRFFATTGWQRGGLAGEAILEVGSGAGRFTEVVLRETKAHLWSVDYSDAVTANWAQNGPGAGGRLHLSQASIYELPFADSSFDKVFCMGVLQHTPNFSASVAALIAKAKIGGEIVVDFYEIRGIWTKLHAKYLLRPFTRRMPHSKLLSLIDRNVDRLIAIFEALQKVKLAALTRFLPLVDLRGLAGAGLTKAQLREWAVLDTFDMYSPEYDMPQRIQTVARMFERAGARVTFAGRVKMRSGSGAVVRGVRIR